ncbi:MAG: hypothetical protein Q9171_005611 [Xanthocarpia ochracea]
MAQHDQDTSLRPPPRYAGEDTRLTSKKELWGWYSYGFAAEVFVVCGIGSFIPIALEQLARERGVLLSDRSRSCKSTLDQPELSGTSVSSSSLLAVRGPLPHLKTGPCIIQLLGTEINTASFAMYTFSISVFIQSLVIISMSGAADHGVYRKRLLLFFAFTGAVATMLFIGVIPKIFLLGGLLAIISNVCFGASFVLLNSFLPLLVRHHPSVQAPSSNDGDAPIAVAPEDEDHNTDDSTAALLENNPNRLISDKGTLCRRIYFYQQKSRLTESESAI